MAAVAAPQAPVVAKSSYSELVQKYVAYGKQTLNQSQTFLTTKSKDAYTVAAPYFSAARPYAPVVVGAIAVGTVSGLLLVRRRA